MTIKSLKNVCAGSVIRRLSRVNPPRKYSAPLSFSMVPWLVTCSEKVVVADVFTMLDGSYSLGGVGAGWSSSLRRLFVCDRCGERLMVTGAEARAHTEECEQSAGQGQTPCGAVGVVEEGPQGGVAKDHYCALCAKTLRLTATAILRHRRAHAQGQS